MADLQNTEEKVQSINSLTTSDSSAETTKTEVEILPSTEEESPALRRVADSIPPSVWLLALVCGCERFTYYGLMAPLQNYIQNSINDPLHPGALGLGQATATNLSYVFSFVFYFTPIGTAVIADNWLNRYQTLWISSIVYLCGVLILFFTSLPSVLHEYKGLGGLLPAMILIGIGVGGFKTCVTPLMADQYSRPASVIKTLKSGEQVLLDYDLTIESIFSILYWSTCIGSMAPLITTWLEQKVGFWSAYLLPLCVFCAGWVFLIVGRRNYVHNSPQPLVLTMAFRVFGKAIRGGFKMDAARPDFQLREHGQTVPWENSFVDELKSVLLICRTLIAYPVYRLCAGQYVNNLKSQAAEMETYGIPNDIIQETCGITIMICLPITQMFIYPALRKAQIPFRPVSRITLGFCLEAMAMGYAAIVQHLVYSSGPCYDAPLVCSASEGGTIPNRVSVFIQVPIYVLEALAGILTAPAMLEVAYIIAPKSMKSMIQAIFTFTGSISSLMGVALTALYQDPRLVILFALLSGLMFINMITFQLFFGRSKRLGADSK